MPQTTGRRLLLAAVLATTLASCTSAPDTGHLAPTGHRAVAKGPKPAADEPQWAAPTHHWTGLTRHWTVRRAYSTSTPDERGLVSDGKRVIALLDPQTGNAAPARITGYDGATGRTLWRKALRWANDADPVAGGGLVIVPSGAESALAPDQAEPVDYVALDTATGKERWRIRVRARAFGRRQATVARPQAAGVLLNGVFYYADGSDVIGVDAATGKPRYRFTDRARIGAAGPVAAGGRIAVLTHDHSGLLSTGGFTVRVLPPDLRRSTSVRLTGPRDHAPERLAASGAVLAVWGEDRLWTVDTGAGRQLARRGLGLSTKVHGVLGRTVLTTDGGIPAGLDLLTGERTWSTASAPYEVGAARFDVADGTACATGVGFALLDPATGKAAYHGSLFGPLEGGLAVAAAAHFVIESPGDIVGYR